MSVIPQNHDVFVGKLRKWEPVGVVGIVMSVRTGRPRNSGSTPGISKKFVSAVCHQFCSTYTANTLPRKHWKGLETLK